MAVRQPGTTEYGIGSQGYAKILWEMEERVAASAHGSRSRTKSMFVSMQSVDAFRAICLGNHFLPNLALEMHSKPFVGPGEAREDTGEGICSHTLEGCLDFGHLKSQSFK